MLMAALATGFAQPVITCQPRSQTNIVGATVTLSVCATGAPPLAYQWRRGGANVAGETNGALVFTNLQPVHAGNYTVVITNFDGAVTSEVAFVRVIVPPTITAQPTNFVTLSLGASVSNRVSASPAPLFYQWRLDGADLAGQTNALIVLTNLQLADVGDYTVAINNAAGSTNSRVARLNVDPTFTKITTGPVVTSGANSFGCAWGDYDNDGFIDLYVTNNGQGQTNFLFRNQGDGTFARVTQGAVVMDSLTAAGSRGCSWGDYDNDGWLDLFVANRTGTGNANDFLYHNNGDGSFSSRTNSPVTKDGRYSSGGCGWADYDNDGFLDLVVTTYGDGNLVYHNNSNGDFTRISNSVIAAMLGVSPSSAWADYDNDGDLDLFVANTGQTNFLFRNDGSGAFTRITTGAIATDVANFSGCAWGDYDNDGDLDLFVASGGAAASENNFLYRNNGDGTFTRITEGIIVNDGGWSNGAAWVDYDNDGHLDLFVNNAAAARQSEFLYHNNGDGSFTKITTGSIVNDDGASPGAAWADYDNDGFLDLFVANGGLQLAENDALYRNNGNSNSWLVLRCVGTASNRSAIGTKVRVRATIQGAVRWQLRQANAGRGWGSQDDPRLCFGLGDATNADLVRIEWPSGTVQELRDVAAKQFLTVTEPPRMHGSMSNGHFQTTLTAWNGQRYLVERSSNLVNWSPFASVTHSNRTMVLTDIPDSPQRFYRAQAE
jgi:hypothetical protein